MRRALLCWGHDCSSCMMRTATGGRLPVPELLPQLQMFLQRTERGGRVVHRPAACSHQPQYCAAVQVVASLKRWGGPQPGQCSLVVPCSKLKVAGPVRLAFRLAVDPGQAKRCSRLRLGDLLFLAQRRIGGSHSAARRSAADGPRFSESGSRLTRRCRAS